MWSFGQGQNKKHTVGADSISARGTCRKLHGRILNAPLQQQRILSGAQTPRSILFFIFYLLSLIFYP